MPESTSDGPALALLSAGAASLARGGELDETLEAILAATRAAVGAASAALFVSDPDRAADDGTPELQLAAAAGLSDDALSALAEAVATEPTHPVARAAALVTPTLGRTGTGHDGAATTGADLSMTVTRDGVEQPLGVASFEWSGAHPIGDEEATLLQAAADLLAVALDRARVSSLVQERAEWYERLAHVDPLTGLANARTLGRVLELEIARAARQGGEVSIALFDVDDFSVVNAVAGRKSGDDVLRRVAAVLGGSVRMVDTVARTGADEFVVVAPGSAGSIVARRIIDAIGRSVEGPDDGVTVSAGVAHFPADGANGEELLSAARSALDDARAQGRGRISGGAGAGS